MQRLEVSCAVLLIYMSLGAKGLKSIAHNTFIYISTYLISYYFLICFLDGKVHPEIEIWNFISAALLR